MQLRGNPNAEVGININDGTQAFTDEIFAVDKNGNHLKTIETRNSPTLDEYIGQRVGIVRTGKNGGAILVGYATIASRVDDTSEKEFRDDYQKHRVKSTDPKFGWKGKTKYGYVLENVERESNPYAVTDRDPGNYTARDVTRDIQKPTDKNQRAVEKYKQGVQFEMRRTANGTDYVVLEDKFLNPDDTPKTENEIYNSLVGVPLKLIDGTTITFIKKTSGNLSLYKEMFKKYPGYDKSIDIKTLNGMLNRDITELFIASSLENPHDPQRHNHVGIVDHEIRKVYLTDGRNAYELKLVIANHTDGSKIGYAKRNIEKAPDKISAAIKEAETARTSRLNQLQNNSTPTLTESQGKDQKQVREAAKNWGAIDNPYSDDMVFYHGTKGDFFRFEDRTGQNHEGYARLGSGHYFTATRNAAEFWAKKAKGEGSSHVMPVYLKTENLLNAYDKPSQDIIDALPEGINADSIIQIAQDLSEAGINSAEFFKGLGYDGIVSDKKTGKGYDRDNFEIVVFSPEQIKSAKTNTYDDAGNVIPLSERFNEQSPDIRYQMRNSAAHHIKNPPNFYFGGFYFIQVKQAAELQQAL